MNEKTGVYQFLIILLTGIVMLGIDSIYLTANRKMFETQIETIQRSSMQINITGVILCYIILILGLYYFIIREKRSNIDAFLMGVFVYGVYETTNYATFKNWDEKLVIIDTLWGGVLFTLTNYIVKNVSNYF